MKEERASNNINVSQLSFVLINLLLSYLIEYQINYEKMNDIATLIIIGNYMETSKHVRSIDYMLLCKIRGGFDILLFFSSIFFFQFRFITRPLLWSKSFHSYSRVLESFFSSKQNFLRCILSTGGGVVKSDGV